MPDNKKHHYVPQFLLRNFAIEGSSNRAIAVADLKAKRFYDKAPIRQQCAKDYLYGKNLEMEKALGELETLASRLIRGAVTNSVLPEDGTQDWFDFLSFLAIQRGRTPASGRQSDKMATYFSREMLKQPGPGLEPPPPEVLSCLEVSNTMSAVESLQVDANLTPQLNDLADLLVVNDTEVDFVLSDLGVVFFNDWARECRDGGVDGFSCQGLQIFLPLSPRYLWIKFDPHVYDARHRSTVKATSLSDVLKVNRMMIASSEQNVYFSGRVATQKMLQDFDNHIRSSAAERVRLVKYRQTDGTGYAIMYQPLPLNVPVDLSFLRQRPLAFFVPLERRGKMHRYFSYSRRTLKGEEGRGPDPLPSWIIEGRFTVEILS
jgi:hypothetical protein